MRFYSPAKKITFAILVLLATAGLAFSPFSKVTVHATEREAKVAEIISITQDGVAIPATANNPSLPMYSAESGYGYYFKIDSLKDLRITFRIADLDADAEYVVLSGIDNFDIYTGAQLAEGVSYNQPVSAWNNSNSCVDYDAASGLCLSTNIFQALVAPNLSDRIGWSDTFNLTWQYDGAKTFICYDQSIITTTPHFSLTTKYANYPDQEVSMDHLISPLYHNVDDPLQIVIQGSGYDDSTEYEISIQADHRDSNSTTAPTEYTLGPITKLGSELNAGITITLDYYLMHAVDYKTSHKEFDSFANYLSVIVDNRTITDSFDYSYEIGISYTYIYGNGQVFAGDEGGVSSGNMSDTEIYVKKGKYDQYGFYAYLIPTIGQFPDDETFTYTLYYFNDNLAGYTYYDAFLLADPVVLETKTVTGREINAGAVGAKYENSQNYEHPGYVAIITDEQDRMLFYAISRVSFTSAPALDSVYLQSNSQKDIFYSSSRFAYVAVNEPGLYLPIHGSNFDPDTTYDVIVKDTTKQCEIVDIYISNCSAETAISEPQTLQISGQDLNDGKITYELPLLSDETQGIVRSVYFSIQLGEMNWTGGGAQIYYTAPDAILNHTSKYQLDNALSTIKGISKNTSLDELQQNIAVANNGSVKLYKDGTELGTEDQVGTGMTIVVLDEFDRPFIEVTASVTGDVTGDGDITITDLVTVARHVAGLTELSGAYKTAGDITGNEDIGITDVVKVSRDIAGLEEIK